MGPAGRLRTPVPHRPGRCDTVASFETSYSSRHLCTAADPPQRWLTVRKSRDPPFCNYPVTHARSGCRASFHSRGHVRQFESRHSANGCRSVYNSKRWSRTVPNSFNYSRYAFWEIKTFIHSQQSTDTVVNVCQPSAVHSAGSPHLLLITLSVITVLFFPRQLSLLKPFTPGLKHICSTNPFLQSLVHYDCFHRLWSGPDHVGNGVWICFSFFYIDLLFVFGYSYVCWPTC